ncbi:MAG: aldehyde dehydrogenase family protein [Candidatus Latescibacterota bacterium]|nr:aldehyde dehydrogenase family protein [Candidatus Latescibacterota bacterium]
MAQNVNEEHIRKIVEEVVQRVVTSNMDGSSTAGGEGGVFQTIDAAVQAATRAQLQLVEMSLEQRKQIVEAFRRTSHEYAEEFSRRALAETGMGRYEDKILKHQVAADSTPGVEDLEATSWTGDNGLTVVEMAPFGVIGAVTPSTHPVPTMVNNAICIVSAGNSVVFNVHPAGKKVSMFAVRLINEAVVKVGGPANLVTAVEEPTLESANDLFNHPGIRLLLVTGGPGVAQAALASPKKAIVAGPGNPPVVVDETADLAKAARDIIDGGAFDNNILCLGEKQVFAIDSIADELKRLMVQYSAYELNAQQIDALSQVAFVDGPDGHPTANRELIGRNASVLGERIGLNLDDSLRMLIGETDANHVFVREEQMMPFLPIVRVPNIDQAIREAVISENGYGHTAIIHSRNIENMHRMARAANTTIFVKNGPSYAGVGLGGEGFGTYSIAGPTGEGLTSPRTFTRQRRCALVDYFRIT